MNEVRFIQKIGQVPMATLVENAARQGFALAGSPTMIGHTPAQLMVHVGVESAEPEYAIISKTGQSKLGSQIEVLMDAGWHIYGSMLAGDVPMQAMVRGDIGVHKMFGMDGQPSPGLPDGWQDAVAKARKEAIEEANKYTDTLFEQVDEQIADLNEKFDDRLKHAVNSINEAGEMLDERVKDNAQQLVLLESAVGELVVKNSKEHDDIYAYVEQTRSALDSDIRGNAIGCNGYTDEAVEALRKQTEIDIGITKDFTIDVGNGIAAKVEEEDDKLRAEIKMETAERQQDVIELNARIDQLGRIIETLVGQAPS